MTTANTSPDPRMRREADSKAYRDAIASARETAQADIDRAAGNSREAFDQAQVAATEATAKHAAAAVVLRALQDGWTEPNVPRRRVGADAAAFDAAVLAEREAAAAVSAAQSKARRLWLVYSEKRLGDGVTPDGYREAIARLREDALADFVARQGEAAVAAHRLAAFSSTLGEDIERIPGDRGTTLQPLAALVDRVHDGLAFGVARRIEREQLSEGAK